MGMKFDFGDDFQAPQVQYIVRYAVVVLEHLQSSRTRASRLLFICLQHLFLSSNLCPSHWLECHTLGHKISFLHTKKNGTRKKSTPAEYLFFSCSSASDSKHKKTHSNCGFFMQKNLHTWLFLKWIMLASRWKMEFSSKWFSNEQLRSFLFPYHVLDYCGESRIPTIFFHY